MTAIDKNNKIKESYAKTIEHDRDVHAAENMLWFAKNKIGVGRTSTLDEIHHSIEEFFKTDDVLLSQEAAKSLDWR